MADTQRTLSALLALLADNTTGDISPQDVRDALVSVMGGYGAISVTGGSTAQTGITGTPAKLTAFTTNGISSGTTPDHTSDQITVLTAGVYLVNASVTFSGSASDDFPIGIRVNGATTGYIFDRKLGTGGDVGCAAGNALLSLSANDIITLYVSSNTGGTEITVTEASLIVTRIA